MTAVSVPAVDTTQWQAVDRLLAAEYGISSLQTLENGGHALANFARHVLDGDVCDRSIVVLAGRRNSGGVGLVAARHLLNWGAWVQVVCTHPPPAYAGDPAQQLATLQAMAAPLAWAEDGWELPPADLVIDAIVGCNRRDEPEDAAADAARRLIQLANSSAAPILSVDLPSGVDGDTGHVSDPHVVAAFTLTLALPRTGLLQPAAAAAAGQIFLADVGVPSALYAQLGLAAPCLFACNSIVALSVMDGGFVISS